MSKYGEVDDIVICDNLGEHILGNVFVKFTTEEYAIIALKNLHGRYYSGKLILPEFSPVIDFRESRLNLKKFKFFL
jgi:splicing factor U2AF subunit